MDRATAERAARRVGFTTLPIGLALLANPSPAAKALGGGDTALRVIAVCDLALVPGLVAGQRKSSWVLARVVLNLGIAGYCLTSGRGAMTSARVAAGAMVLASVADLRTTTALRQAGVARSAGRPSTR